MNISAQDQEKYLQELKEFLKIPSVSADRSFHQEVLKAATFLKDKLLEAGAQVAELCPTKGFPVVYAERMADPSLPTVLVYGHYDVQPPDPLDLWESPPFEPVIKNGRIVARGACDDKGQLYMHVKALERMNQRNEFPCNLKFMFEGEEEVGSDNLGPFLQANKEKLKADLILVSDTSIFSTDVPTITVGLRGLSYLEVEVTGPNRDLHSGMYGGAVANPINALCQMIASLKDEHNHIVIPGFYDKVLTVSDEERGLMNQIPFSLSSYQDALGINAVSGEMGYTTLERVSIRPTLDVNGIWGGYTGEGAKTVLPSKAYAKISMRLVPNQEPDEITRLFTEHFIAMAPPGIQVKVTPHHGGEPALTPTDSAGYRAASLAFQKVWGKTPLPMRSGGSIPIVSMFEKVLGLKTVLMGFGLDEDAIHSPNESYRLDHFFKGIESIEVFYKELALQS
ncbi:MAG: dipeptidase [Cytophagaceae bacterium]|jgi:acetylornithine deacetylase/succinyl-diaminopimelate desuccinylase-like protein|nr:dipeptidase [Cytophagaceae bacterium]